jgi:hypothetical protein
MKKKDHFWLAVFCIVLVILSLLLARKYIFPGKPLLVTSEKSVVVPVSIPEETSGAINTNRAMSTLVAPVDLNAIRASLVRRKAEAEQKALTGGEETFLPETDGVINVNNVSVAQ